MNNMEWTFWPQSPKKPRRVKVKSPVIVESACGTAFAKCEAVAEDGRRGKAQLLLVYGFRGFSHKRTAVAIVLELTKQLAAGFGKKIEEGDV